MRLILCLTAALALSAGSTQALAKTYGFQINNTSWTFVDPDKKVKVRESIDAHGNYVENAVSGKHIDHEIVPGQVKVLEFIVPDYATGHHH